MKYRILIIIIFFLSFSTVNAQWVYHFSDNQNRCPGSEDLQLMKVDVQLGTSFISSFAGSPMISSYIAPTLNFNIFPHFNLNVGGILMNNHTSVFNQLSPEIWNRAFYLAGLTPILHCLLQEIILLVISYWFTGVLIQANS